MSHRDTVNAWLQELSKVAEKEFALGDNDICGIKTETGLEILVELAEDRGAAYLRTRLLALDQPEERTARIKADAMAANLLNRETGGMVLSTDHEGQFLVLHYMVDPSATDHTGFVNTLGVFVEIAEKLKTRFAGAAEEAQADEPVKPTEAVLAPHQLSPFQGGWGIRG